MRKLRGVALAAMVLAIAGCSSSTSAPTPPPATASSGAPAAAVESGFTLALPWDTSASPSHEIMCAYGSEGITSSGTAGGTAGCAHHQNGPAGYTQDGDALDFDLHSGDAVHSVDAGVVRWAKAYTGSSSWSCYGNSIAIDDRLADGTVVTAFYAHLSSVTVAVGDQITQGKEIGKAGGSGGGTNSACPSAYGPHLHFALYTNANYTDANGAAVAATALPAGATGSDEPVTSPPYGGTARVPEPWLDCSRHSALATPPSGEDATCASLHAGDVLTQGAGQAPASPGQSAAALGPRGFSLTGSMTGPREGQDAVRLLDGRVLLVGGSDVMGHQVGIATAEVYDPQTGTFSGTGSMAAAQGQSEDVGFAATLLTDGRVIVVGTFAKPELYDPNTGKFSVIGSGPDGCESCTATLLADGRVLIIGGAVAEIYDPNTGTFSPTGKMVAFQGSRFTATLLPDGRVLVAGDQGVSVSAELFDPKTDQFSPTGPMITPRHEHTAILLANGQVLLLGGFDPHSHYLASAELYDPGTGSFSPTGSMPTPWIDGTSTLLADGRVLVAGGTAGNGVLASAEVYDPKTGAFTSIGSMTTARFAQSATLLTDGRVLIAGGVTADGSVLASAELFHP